MNNTVIKITRGNEYFGGGRKLKVFIDGVHAGNAEWNETSDFPVIAGQHEVYVKMDWCRSAPFIVDLPEGDAVELEVSIPPEKLAKLVAPFLKPSRFFGLRER